MRKRLMISLIMVLVILGTLILGTNTVKGAVSLGGNTSVKQGDTVKITVYYGETVKNAQFIFTYDATKLTYSGVVGGKYNPANGRFTTGITEETIDTLSSATFTFTAKETGSAVFNIANVKFASANKGKFDGVVPNPSISTTISPKTTPKPPVTDPEKPSGGNSGNNGGSTSKPNNNNSNTTTKNPTFTGGTATVYVTENNVNVRDKWENGKIIGKLNKNAKVTRTGVSSNGWTRVNFNGGVAYISSQYLTTTKPKEDKKDDDKDDDKNNTTNNTTNNETNNEVNNTTNNVENGETNSTTNELVNNEHQGSNQVQNEKKDNKNYIEFIIIGVIILAILVIIVSEILAKKKSKKKSKR